MKLYLSPIKGDDQAEILVSLLESSLQAHGIYTARAPRFKIVTYLRQFFNGDLAVRIGFGWSEIARNHGTIAIYAAGDVYSESVATALANRVGKTLNTQLRGFKRGGSKPDSREAFGQLKNMHSPAIKHNVVLMVCYSSNESNMTAYRANQRQLITELTDELKYWVS